MTLTHYGPTDLGFGFKLYNEEHSLWSWHETLFDASVRLAMEQQLYGRAFQIAAVTRQEAYAYRDKLQAADGEASL